MMAQLIENKNIAYQLDLDKMILNEKITKQNVEEEYEKALNKVYFIESIDYTLIKDNLYSYLK